MGTLYWNGASFTPVDDATQRVNTVASLAVEGKASAEYQLIETDQTSPAGRYRARVSADQYVIQRAASTGPDPYATVHDLLTIDKEGAEFHVPLDVGGLSPFVANIVEYLGIDDVRALEWIQGHGPTADPDGYAVINVAEGKLGIVPYWDYRG